jgi:2-polyprenyl-3-methyl-5-hydroxy-6-metoxy-1,4-benzoquinol methylase
MREAVLEPILRRMRLAKVLPTIRRYPECDMLDIGCGWENLPLRSVEPYIRSGVGIDFKVEETHSSKLQTRRMVLDQSLPAGDSNFDVVTMLAVLEHLAYPEEMLREILRVLRPAGAMVITVPSRASKPVLEFLAYRLHIVSEPEIRDHERYYNREDLLEPATATGFSLRKHQYFRLGMNNFAVFARKGA